MLTTPVEQRALRAAASKVCGGCSQRLSLAAFVRDDSRPDGRHRLCNPCRAEAARARRARLAEERAAEREQPAPAPTGRGPERIEPGAILMALEELQRAPTLVPFPGLTLGDLPSVLRPLAVVGVDDVLVVPRQRLIDFVLAQKRRVGDYRMNARPVDLSERAADRKDVEWARRRQAQSDN